MFSIVSVLCPYSAATAGKHYFRHFGYRQAYFIGVGAAFTVGKHDFENVFDDLRLKPGGVTVDQEKFGIGNERCVSPEGPLP